MIIFTVYIIVTLEQSTMEIPLMDIAPVATAIFLTISVGPVIRLVPVSAIALQPPVVQMKIRWDISEGI